MEFDEIVVKESPGLCRCCLSEGCYKDLGSEYTWMNDTEVYADMLLECFDISISQHNDGPNGANRLICEVCITRLRDACNFKKQVLDSEKKFIDMVARGEFRPKVLVYQTQTMKPEPITEEPHREEAEIEYLEDEMDFGDDEPLKRIEALDEVTEDPTVSEDITVATLPVKGKRGRPRKSDTPAKPERKAKVPKLEDKPRSSKAIVKDESETTAKIQRDESAEDKKAQIKPAKRREIMRRNVTEVIMKSNLLPFRWLTSSFRCFYCYDLFKVPNDLKAHSATHTDSEDIHKAMKNYWDPVVYVDVSNISCKLCLETMKDLNHLIEHLIADHEIKYNKDIGTCITGFKLQDISVACAVCDKSFNTFNQLLTHYLEHDESPQLLCDICAQSVKSEKDMRVHMRTIHNTRTFKCNECDASYPNQHGLRMHCTRVHKKMYKCFECTEEFVTRYHRSKHVSLVHKSRELSKCPHCPQSFVYQSTMIKHIKSTHLQEKNVVCNICGWRGFKSFSLATHMLKHSDERAFNCPACDKAFKSKKTMKQHYHNIHEKVNKTT